MTLDYKYPVHDEKRKNADDSGIIQKEGQIRTVNLSREPYEAFVEAEGFSFHILFGAQRSGNFLCIPNWRVGCELSFLSDTFWNSESIGLDDSIRPECAAAIAYALKEIDLIVNA